MIPYEPSHRRRTAALATLGIMVASHVAGMVAGLGLLVLVQWMSGGGAVPPQLVRLSRISFTFAGAVAFHEFAAQTACAVAFSMWFHRVYRNLPALGATNLSLTPARAVGGFYIPFINLIRPYKAMGEIWRHSQLPASDPLLGSVKESRWIKAWWLSFLAVILLGNLEAVFQSRIDSLSAQFWATVSMIVSSALAIVAGVSARILVRRISALQDARHAYLGEAAEAARR